MRRELAAAAPGCHLPERSLSQPRDDVCDRRAAGRPVRGGFVAGMFPGDHATDRGREKAVGAPPRVVCAVQCAAGGMEYREWRVLFRVRGECKWLAGERWRGSNEVTAGLPSVCVGGAAVA
jgi:hypothetical protein